MEPAVVLLANVANFVQWIESTQNGCAGSGIDEEWNLTASLALQNQTLQFTWNHFAVLVGWNADAVLRAQAANGSARLDRVVTLVRSEHAQVAGQSAWSVLLVVGEFFVASSQEGIQVGNGTAWSQNRVAAMEADDVTHLGQDDVLHENKDWRDFVREHVGVGSGSQPFASHRHDVQATRQLIEEVRMT